MGIVALVSTGVVVAEEARQQTVELGMPIEANAIYLRISPEHVGTLPRVLGVRGICKRGLRQVRTVPVSVGVEVVAPARVDDPFPGWLGRRRTGSYLIDPA